MRAADLNAIGAARISIGGGQMLDAANGYVATTGFAGGVEADNTAEAPKYELSTTDYDECLACQ